MEGRHAVCRVQKPVVGTRSPAPSGHDGHRAQRPRCASVSASKASRRGHRRGAARAQWGVIHGTGFPAITFPGGFSRPTRSAPLGVPIGIELLGPEWSEPHLIRLAYAFEQAAQLRGPGIDLSEPRNARRSLERTAEEMDVSGGGKRQHRRHLPHGTREPGNGEEMLRCSSSTELVARCGHRSHRVKAWENIISRAVCTSGVCGPKNMAIRRMPMPWSGTQYSTFF